MLKNKTSLLKSAALALTVALPISGGAFFYPVPAIAATTLPAPYVSRALDAVLMPVDASVISTFGLANGTKGVLIIATDPAGLAALAGLEPGDVIEFVKGEAISTPLELDEIVYYWIQKNAFDFAISAIRAGAPYKATTTITLEAWESVIDVTVVESWSSYSYESFSYSEYYSEYSEEISESYESSEALIEESVTSEEFEADMETADEDEEDGTDDEMVDADGDGQPDAEADADGDGQPDAEEDADGDGQPDGADDGEEPVAP